jgi:hypothetical protein
MTKQRGYYDDDGNEHGYGDRDDDNGHHGEGDDDGFVHRFGTVDANAIDPTHPGQMYFGNGNLATGYNIADNAGEHVELGLKVHPRGGPDQTPVFNSHTGDPTYTEAAGLQIATPGHERANWNFDFSVDTALGGGNHTLGQFDFKLTIANATHSETFDLNATNHLWISEQNPTHAFGGDDFNHPASLGVQNSEAENSVNLAFSAFNDFGSLASRLAAGQHYEVTLQALEHHDQIAAVHNFIVLA